MATHSNFHKKYAHKTYPTVTDLTAVGAVGLGRMYEYFSNMKIGRDVTSQLENEILHFARVVELTSEVDK